jgi:type VI secretion system secreted protein Hcp
MAADMFLKLDGIDGESRDAKHKGEIEIESFSWGASRPAASPGGGGGPITGKVVMQDFSFTTPVSKASPKLFLALVENKQIKTALLSVRRTGDEQRDFLKVTMSDVRVLSWKQEAGAVPGLPSDQVSMNFSKLQIAYTGQSPTGGAGETVTATWDGKGNTKV